MTKVSISELEKLRAEMKPGEYVRGSWKYTQEGGFRYTHIEPASDEDACISVLTDPPVGMADHATVVTGCGCCGSPSGERRDVDGLIAEHNAMPVLLEVAKAGKALIAAKNSNAQGDDYWRPFYDALNTLRDALAKVGP